MASESADPALSPDVISFVIAGKALKLCDPIHSTRAGAIKKRKMVHTFGDAFATAMPEGVFMGRGSRHEYRVKWTNLSDDVLTN